MVLLLEASYRYVLQIYITQGAAEAEPHGANIDWRPVPGDHNPSQFCKARKSSPTLWLLPHFAFLQSHTVYLTLCALSCFLQDGMRATGPILTIVVSVVRILDTKCQALTSEHSPDLLDKTTVLSKMFLSPDLSFVLKGYGIFEFAELSFAS